MNRLTQHNKGASNTTFICFSCVSSGERYYVPLTSAVNNGDEIREKKVYMRVCSVFFYVATATIVVFSELYQVCCASLHLDK